MTTCPSTLPLIPAAWTLLLAGCGAQPPAPAADARSPAMGVEAAAGAPQPEPAPAALVGALVGLNVAWADRYRAGDLAALAAMLAPDAVWMTPVGDVTGRDAIRRHLAAELAARPDSILATNTATESVDVAGDRAYEAGTVTYPLRPRAGGPTRTRQARYVNWWQRTPDGAWLLRRSLRAP